MAGEQIFWKTPKDSSGFFNLASKTLTILT